MRGNDHDFKVGDIVRVTERGTEFIITQPGSIGCVVEIDPTPSQVSVRFVKTTGTPPRDSIDPSGPWNIYPNCLETLTRDDLTDDEIVALVAVKLKYL